MKSKNMVEGKSKKIEQAKRGTKVGMDEDPIKEGVFDFRSTAGMCFWVFTFLGLREKNWTWLDPI